MLIAMILLSGVPAILAQTQSPPSPGQATTPPALPSAGQAPPTPAVPDQRLEVYGYVMTDFGYNFETINPDWFDVMRPTKLPSFRDEFGRDGKTFAGLRQTRFGVKGFQPTKYGELKTTFEFELFGVGVDTGQTTFRLRHAYGELGHFGAGQTWSPFMDIDTFPNSIEYWGPNGMAFFRNVQVRWMPIQGDTRLTIALERPGSSQDPGRLEDRIEIANVLSRFPYPDLSGEFRWGGKRGYLEAAAIVGNTRLDDVLKDQFNLDQNVNRWGVNLTSNLKFGAKNVLKAGYVFGEGMRRPFTHSVLVRPTAFQPAMPPPSDKRVEFHSLYGDLIGDESRNRRICEDVVEAVQAGRSPLVLTERNEHLESLANQLAGRVDHVIVLRGGMPRSHR